jgi:effector-binding domain-containing protein
MTSYLQTTPVLTERPEQPYVAIRGTVTMTEIAAIADRLPDVFGWLAEHDAAPVGAPFFRYLVIDMGRRLEIEVGVPVAAALEGSGDVVAGVLPAGRYATVRHRGHPDELVAVTGELLAWAQAEGLTWDMTTGEDGEHWACRLEVYNTDPRVEPDLNNWVTDLAFKTG